MGVNKAEQRGDQVQSRSHLKAMGLTQKQQRNRGWKLKKATGRQLNELDLLKERVEDASLERVFLGQCLGNTS